MNLCCAFKGNVNQSMAITRPDARSFVYYHKFLSTLTAYPKVHSHLVPLSGECPLRNTLLNRASGEYFNSFSGRKIQSESVF